MIKRVFICTVLVLVFLEFSLGKELDAKVALNGIRVIRDELEKVGDQVEDVLDFGITPLIDRFNEFFNKFEELCKDLINKPAPLYE